MMNIEKHVSLNLDVRGIDQSATLAINERSKDLQAKGNKVYRNGYAGIRAEGDAIVEANTVYDQSADNSIGIALAYGAAASHNVVYGNYDGIRATYSGAGVVSANRVYNNIRNGIWVTSTSGAQDNVVYSNEVGI